ncbi:5-(carboxyamino)imidazole ribonucleotide synthase, partial [Neisseria sp. P0017.S005]
FLAKHSNVCPSGDCVAIALNRIQEKAWIRIAGLQTAPYQAICRSDDLSEESAQFLPGILKTPTLGYDGKGQLRVKTV